MNLAGCYYCDAPPTRETCPTCGAAYFLPPTCGHHRWADNQGCPDCANVAETVAEEALATIAYVQEGLNQALVSLGAWKNLSRELLLDEVKELEAAVKSAADTLAETHREETARWKAVL